MKKRILLFICVLLAAQTVYAHVLEELWDKYSALSQPRSLDVQAAPGRIIGDAPGSGVSAFDYGWRYRPQTYEMHFANPEELARSVYSLAAFARDISPDMPRERFYRGVLGFHYTAAQIADWLNYMLANHKPLTLEENKFAGEMLKEGIIGIGEKGFQPGNVITHALGAAPGKKRSFERNLLHERLHVFWDENAKMREDAENAWRRLDDTSLAAIREKLRNYAQNNEKQLMEEWAIGNAEENNFSIE